MQTCGQIMSRNPASSTINDSVETAAKLMKTEDVGSIPVVQTQESRRLVGIITDRDIVVNVVAEGRDAKSTRAEQVMTRNPVTCRENDDVQKALDAMTEHQVRRILVVDNSDRLIGIIAQADVATRTDNPQKTAQVVEEISKPVQAAAH